MSGVAALTCPSCGSAAVRRSRRSSVAEKFKMWLGVYPFRCNACGGRFGASVWLFAIWRWARCPRCLNINLTGWPKRPIHQSAWDQFLVFCGARKHRCSRCRHNFIAFRPRLPGDLLPYFEGRTQEPAGDAHAGVEPD